MSLYCDHDGLLASFPPPGPPPAKPERNAPWRPPDTSSSTCMRCNRAAWQHRSHPPVLADEIDRAIYAVAYNGAIDRGETPKDAISIAEFRVDAHRRARSGT